MKIICFILSTMTSIRQNLSRGDQSVGFDMSNDTDSLHKPHKIEYTEKYLERNFHIQSLEQDDIIDKTIHYLRKYYTPSRQCLLNYFFKRVPIFKWIQNYDLRKDFFKDLIAGLTVTSSFYLISKSMF